MLKKLLLCFVLLQIASFKAYPQLSIGILSGTSTSDIRGNQNYGKWHFKPGSIWGFYLNYSFNNFFSVQTELNKTTLYYEHEDYYNNYPDYLPHWHSSSSSYVLLPWYYPHKKWDFQFYRMPLMVNFSTPTRLQINFLTGIYFAKLVGSSSPYYYAESKFPEWDFGYIFSSGVSYPLSEVFRLSLAGRYVTGRRVYIDEINGKNGAAEILLGIEYIGLSLNKNKEMTYSRADSSRKKIIATYSGGINITQNKSEGQNNSYSSSNGITASILLDFQISPNLSFRTGLNFEQKGYSLRDTSWAYFIYQPRNNNINLTQTVDSRIGLDYLSIPLLFSLHFGKRAEFYLNYGLYYGVLINARVTGISLNVYRFENNITTTRVTIYDDIEGEIRNDDWGWAFGTGLRIPLYKSYRLDIGLRYNSGWSNILANSGKFPNGSDTKLQNQAVGLNIGLVCPFY